jgi:hypothetical protein
MHQPHRLQMALETSQLRAWIPQSSALEAQAHLDSRF